MRNSGNHALPGMVSTQLVSWPSGAVGPKYRSCDPSSLALSVPVLLARAGQMVEGTWRRDRGLGVVDVDRPEVLRGYVGVDV
jgi:hypothetical protein